MSDTYVDNNEITRCACCEATIDECDCETDECACIATWGTDDNE